MTENEARQMEVEIKWNGRANVCVHCGKVPETYYITTGHDHTDDSIRYCFCRSATSSIEQLQAKVAELEEENTRLKVELVKYRDAPVVAYRHLMEDGWEYFDAPTGDDCPKCVPLIVKPGENK